MVLVVHTSAAAMAHAGPVEEASAWKDKGDAAFDERRFSDAFESYQVAQKTHRDARLHYNIAQSLSALERYPEALEAYQAFLAEAPPGTLNEAQQATLFRLVEELKGKLTRLDLTCDVVGARVLVRGKAVGTTPLAGAVVLNAGEAKLEVLAEGYKPYSTTMVLSGGATVPLRTRLERVDFTGLLSVTSNVAGAQVSVDGAPVGVTPLQVRTKQGSHVVVVKAPAHVEQSRMTTIAPGKRTEVLVSLERAPDYTTAYIGFGLGAAGLAAGTATGILAYVRLGKAKEQCDGAAKECGPAGQDELRASQTWGLLSTVSFGLGAAGIALGGYGLATAKPGVREAPVTVTAGTGGLSLRGRF